VTDALALAAEMHDAEVERYVNTRAAAPDDRRARAG